MLEIADVVCLFWTAFLCSGLGLPAAEAPDRPWPQWCGAAGRNMVSGQTGLPESFDAGLGSTNAPAPGAAATRNVRWIAELGPRTCGSPVVAGGRIVIGSTTAGGTHYGEKGERPGTGFSSGRLMCLDEKTGSLVWSLTLPKLPGWKAHPAETGYGFCSTATVEGDRAYVVSSRGEVLCLDMKGMFDGNDGPFMDEAVLMAGWGTRDRPVAPVDLTPDCGDILWLYDMIDALEVRPHDASGSSVLVHGDFVYVCTGNGRNDKDTAVPRPFAPSLIVVNRYTGRLVARDEERIGTRMWQGQWSSPALSSVNGRERIVFGAGDGHCYAFEPVAAEDPARVLALVKLWALNANCAKYRDPNFVVPERPTRAPAPSEIIGTPVCHGSRVYVTVGRDPVHPRADGCLTCIDAETGERRWSYEAIGPCLATASVSDGLLYIGESCGKLHCLDAESGTVQWTHEAGAEIWSSTLVADGKVYSPSHEGVRIFEAGRRGRMLARVELGAPIYASPAAANGVLYFASTRHLLAVALRGTE